MITFGEVLRPVGIEQSAGYIDEPARVDHVHILEKNLLDFLTNSTDTNMIDNPEFKHYQRPLPITGINQFGFDRWNVSVAGAAVWSHAVGTSWPTGVQTSGLFTVTTADAAIAAGDTSFLSHGVEGYVTAPALFGSSVAKPVTLSFWARASLTGTYTCAIRNTSVTRSYVKEYSLVANTWTKVVLTFPGCIDGTWDIVNGVGFALSWAWSCGSTFQTSANTWAAGNFISTSNQVNLSATIGNTFSITQVQLTVGTFDPPFKQKNHVDDLNKCRRYFQRYIDPPLRGVVSGTAVIGRAGMTFVVPMRTTPTVTATGTASWYDGTVVQNQNALAASFMTSLSAEHDVGFPGFTFTIGRAGCLYQGGGSVWSYSAEI